MLHLTGCALLMLAAFGLRMRLQAERRAQRAALRAISDALSALEYGVRATLTPLPRLLQSVPSEGAARSFFAEVSAYLRCGVPLGEAWTLSARALPLPERESARLSALSAALSGDEQRVCAALSLAARELSSAEQILSQRERETARVTDALCLGGGAIVCILLL